MHPRARQRLRLLAIIALPLIAVAATALMSPRTLWTTTDGGDIASSLGRASDLRFPLPCSSIAAGRWTCEFEADAYSGIAGEYRVRLDRDGCWTTSVDRNYGRLRGCVNALDYAFGWWMRH